MMNSKTEYDVVIVGAGIAGAIVAYELGKAGKKVLILEAGPAVPADRSKYMDTFFKAAAKTPESPYPPATQNAVANSPNNPLGLPDPSTENTPRYTVLQVDAWRKPTQCYFDYPPQDANVSGTSLNAKFAFASSYERIGGGTTWHWLGTCLRLLPQDFELKTLYGQGVDWPGGEQFYQDLVPFYEKADQEINVAGDKQRMQRLYEQFGVDPSGTYGNDYDFPMPGIVPALQDRVYEHATLGMKYEGNEVYVSPTPQGRNSRPGERRQCAGNTNCIPICPIQAKYDATVTLARALQTGNVEIRYQHVASNIQLDSTTQQVCAIDYISYTHANGIATGQGSVTGKRFVLAAHAIETPKLLLMSNKNPGFENGVANSSDQVGRNLMDHIMYLGWGLAEKPIYPYRGPLSTGGIESLRDGDFRKQRSAYRIEIGNEGWQWAANDPGTTLADFIFGQNNSQLNGYSVNQQGQELRLDDNLPANSKLFGQQLVHTLNQAYTRQLRLGYLIEQLPDANNRVELSSTLKDNLGLPRPKVTYRLASDYERKAFVSAKQITTELFTQLGATEYTQDPGEPNLSNAEDASATKFQYQDDSGTLHNFKFYGAGHIVGTYRMGDDPATSVLNHRQQSWDHANLYMVGSGVFPTIGTGNPTLTIAALAFQGAGHILDDLAGA
ncbi:GMC family oxidoreductase [Pseudoalteromonas sp. MM17-2]|uniref:GMC family oxidoreductase n=1 Tax=Pseudoalteromonas sp. MM17-2 TaxID=2917753 RepID=UPI001EF5BA07|nr:GMC family oxidoreductase [Pseudoalteromonas sp. MM17-2]MCG7543608.1 GMC family oxidoreductase [Pseudoalteromonas sp. MM17-2]